MTLDDTSAIRMINNGNISIGVSNYTTKMATPTPMPIPISTQVPTPANINYIYKMDGTW